jgi:uncharacterized protein YyaL (SSP411 family)
MQYCLLSLLLTFSVPDQAQWLINFREAQTQAQQEAKPILMVFSGSDWCRPCIQMERDIFSQAGFLEFAHENLVLLKVDFPRKRKNQLSTALQQHHAALAARYNPEGSFPLVVLLNPDGEVLLQTQSQAGGLGPFLSLLQKAIED